MTASIWIACVACTSWLAGSALATTYEIRPDGTGDFVTIQDGVNAAVDGDVLVLTNGTFTNIGNRDVDYIGKEITIRSESGDPSTCTVDCEGTGRGFVFQSFETSMSRLEAISVINGNATGGAGIRCDDATPTITGCIVRSNDGDGILVTGFDAATVTIENCIVDLNTGSGVRLQTSSRGAISGCSIDSNGNSGLYVFNGGEATISDCRIRGNVSPTSGGGIVALQNANFELTECVITGNHASTLGGGVFVSEGSFDMASTTISGNRASLGGGIYVDEDAALDLVQVIVWGNCADVAGDEIHASDLIFDVDFTCSNTDPAGIEGTDVNFVGTNVFTDPLFCEPLSCSDAPATGGDYSLDVGSPCLAGVSPCAQLIGALGLGCTDPTPTREASWSEVKDLFGR